MEADPLTTTQEVAQEFSVDHSVVIWHLRQIGKVKKFEKLVPPELTTNQKNHHFGVLSFLILHNSSEPFLDRIVICNKKWILYYNQQRSAQWSCTKKKVMVTVWWPAVGLIHYNFLNPSETITSEK